MKNPRTAVLVLCTVVFFASFAYVAYFIFIVGDAAWVTDEATWSSLKKCLLAVALLVSSIVGFIYAKVVMSADDTSASSTSAQA